MSRILFWLGLVFLVIFAIRSKIRKAQQRHQEQFRQPPGQPSGQAEGPTGYKARGAGKAAADAETMLECAQCGVFFPATEAVHAHGRIYCSTAHAVLPPA